MDCKDLMIGDWVHYNLRNKYCQVKGITDNGFVIITSLDEKYLVTSDDINPIPLTEEILVKNGFKKESQTIGGDYCKYTLPRFVLNWCDTDGFWYQNGDITSNHVHQLQHLLQLCGIEKEITL